MYRGGSGDDSSTMAGYGPFSDQSKMISNALRQADKAMTKADYMYSENMRGAPNIYEETSGESSYEDSSHTTATVRTGYGTRSNPIQQQQQQPQQQKPPAPGPPKPSLNLRSNDTQFHIIADLIVSKYDHLLQSGAQSFSVSIEDKQQLDRMVSRDSFVDAVRFRLESCPEQSQLPIHVITRKCRALGLHRMGNENLLYAPAGTMILIEPSYDIPDNQRPTASVTESDGSLKTAQKEKLSRQQLLAELREASNLMAESVTPEAAQFWRKHVVELQTRLKKLQPEIGPSSGAGIAEAKGVLHQNDRLVASLNDNNMAYVRMGSDELSHKLEGDGKTETQMQKDEGPYQSKYQNIEIANQEVVKVPDLEMQAIPTVDVVAPANLPEGYTFEAEVENRRFLATVPIGGVRKGQAFTCYMRNFDENLSNIPTENWRDGLFDCFKHGASHPMLLNSCFCPLYALSQVMTRLGIDFMGYPSPDVPRTGVWSAAGMTTTITVFWALLNTFILLGLHYKVTRVIPISGADIASFALVNVGMYVYLVYATSNTRTYIREKYKIHEASCRDLGDILGSATCTPCVISQMGRHTASYEDHKGVCCTDTGLEPGVEVDFTSRHHRGSYRLW